MQNRLQRLVLAALLGAIVAGCHQRPKWVRPFPADQPNSPTRFYNVEHLFAKRYGTFTPPFDLGKALDGRSSGPSTDLDWAYNDVALDQENSIRRVVELALSDKGMHAESIQTHFTLFEIRATPRVHREIERVLLSLSENPVYTLKKRPPDEE